MKTTTTLLFCCFFASTLFSQTPYTINSANFPVYGFQLFERRFAVIPFGVNLIPDTNGIWDFSNLHSIDTADINYSVETDPFYTSVGINVYQNSFKLLNQGLGYAIDYEYDFNVSGVEEKGIYVSEYQNDIGFWTGNPNDKMYVPLQMAVYSTGRKFMKFPATYQSSWRSQSQRIVNFNLTITDAGLINAPVKHVFTIFRSDTIIGWGQMRVYSNGSPSIPYNVLIDRVNHYTVDSFFINGQPMPGEQLSPINVSQGQITSFSNFYNVYRSGYSCPLAVFNYGNDDYTTPVTYLCDIQNLSPSTDIQTPVKADFTTLLFPNPSISGEINLQILGDVPDIRTYELLDMQGRIIQSGSIAMGNGMLHFSFNEQICNGHYVLRVLDDKKQTVITEQLVLGH